jgi:hypothetical protein
VALPPPDVHTNNVRTRRTASFSRDVSHVTQISLNHRLRVATTQTKGACAVGCCENKKVVCMSIREDSSPRSWSCGGRVMSAKGTRKSHSNPRGGRSSRSCGHLIYELPRIAYDNWRATMWSDKGDCTPPPGIKIAPARHG